MTSSTLNEMRAIESEADSVRLLYETKVRRSKDEITVRLDSVSKTHQELLDEELAMTKASYQQKLSELEHTIAQKIENNNALVLNTLSSKKDALVQQILDGVMSKYGN